MIHNGVTQHDKDTAYAFEVGVGDNAQTTQNEIISDVEHYFALPSALAATKWLLFRDVRIHGVSGVGWEWAGRGNAARRFGCHGMTDAASLASTFTVRVLHIRLW